MKRRLVFAAFAMTGGLCLAASTAQAQLSIGISVDFAPPALPIYDQPPIPGPDYIWVPGYWAWDSYWQDYFWIPGTWMRAPRPGLLWTPAWWGWQDGAYVFHDGYWGPHVGFYGGVSYGFGYTGAGYEGAYWNGGHVYYNRSVTNITNVNVTNVYDKTVVVNRITNVSYNGGPGGVQARPSADEQAAMREPHVAATPVQQQHVEAARSNRQLFASANHSRPAVAATPKPAMFSGPGIVATKQAAAYHPDQRTAPPAEKPSAPAPGPNSRAETSPFNGNPSSQLMPERQTQPNPSFDERQSERQERPAGALPNEQPRPSFRNPDRANMPPQVDRPYQSDDHAPPPRAMAPERVEQHPSAPPRPPHPNAGPPHPRGEGHPKPPPHHDDHHD